MGSPWAQNHLGSVVLGVLLSLAKLGRIGFVFRPFWVTSGSSRAQNHLGSVVLAVLLLLRLAKLSRTGSRLGPFWDHFGISLGPKPSRVNSFRCPLASKPHWAVVGPFWDQFGVTLGPKPSRVSSFRSPFASKLGHIGSYWVFVGFILDHFGAVSSKVKACI